MNAVYRSQKRSKMPRKRCDAGGNFDVFDRWLDLGRFGQF